MKINGEKETNMSLTLYDGVMLTIVIVCVIQGALKGMAWQLAPIASLVVGYLFGVPLSTATAPWFGQPPLNGVFSLITMYMLVSLGVYLIARSLRESIEKLKLVEFDRHLGALLGGVKGVLFTTVLTVGLLCVYPSAASMIVKSETRGVAEQVIGFVSPLLPKNVHDVIDPYLKPIEDLPDEEPRRSVVKEEAPFDVQETSEETPAETFTPRRRRSQAIYEEDLTDTTDRSSRRFEDESVEEESPPPKRRRTTEDSSREYDSASEDNAFGADPTQAFEESQPTKRR